MHAWGQEVWHAPCVGLRRIHNALGLILSALPGLPGTCRQPVPQLIYSTGTDARMAMLPYFRARN